MDKGDIVQVKLHGLSHDGRAVGRLKNGITVFVQGALPWQTVEAEIINNKKNFLEAKQINIIEKSGFETVPLCKHSDLCGGCSLMGLDYDKQLLEKSLILKNTLIRIGQFEDFNSEQKNKILPILSVKNIKTNYDDLLIYFRNKMEFAFSCQDTENLNHPNLPLTKLGLKKRYSHEIIEVTDCKLQSPLTMEILRAVRAYCHEKSLTFLRYLVIRTFSSQKTTVELITYPLIKNKFAVNCVDDLAKIINNISGVNGVLHSERRAKTDVAYAEKIMKEWGDTKLSENLNLYDSKKNISFLLGNRAFFQINTKMTEILYAVILKFASFVLQEKNNHIWDIYCGVGSIGLSIADLAINNQKNNDYFGQDINFINIPDLPKENGINKKPFALGIESVASAIDLAKLNVKNMPKDHDFFQFEIDEAKNLSKYFKKYQRPDLIIFDPPRGGVDKEALFALLKNPVPFCIMVSCNPSSLARDLKILSEKYDILAVQAVDMFPHTTHLETVVLLALK